jgi:Fic family protein
MHERLVSIHPFIDGNGRTSRLVMNFILLRHGYTLANLKGDEESRMAYYQALERVQLDADPEPFYHLILDRVKESLEEHLELV